MASLRADVDLRFGTVDLRLKTLALTRVGDGAFEQLAWCGALEHDVGWRFEAAVLGGIQGAIQGHRPLRQGGERGVELLFDLDAFADGLLQTGLGQGGVGRRADLRFGAALDQAHQAFMFGHIQGGAMQAALQAQGFKEGGGHLREGVELGFADAGFGGAQIGLGQLNARAELAARPQRLLDFGQALAEVGVGTQLRADGGKAPPLGGFDIKACSLGLVACLQDAGVPVGTDFEQLFEGEVGRQGG